MDATPRCTLKSRSGGSAAKALLLPRKATCRSRPRIEIQLLAELLFFSYVSLPFSFQQRERKNISRKKWQKTVKKMWEAVVVAIFLLFAVLYWRRRNETRGLPSVIGVINFGGGTHDGSSLATPVSTRIYDGRAAKERFTLEKQGFALVDTPEMNASGVDVYDAQQTVSHLFPIAEAVALKHCPGATRALAFDHILRNPQRLEAEAAEDLSDKKSSFYKKPATSINRREPVTRVTSEPIRRFPKTPVRRCCKGCSAPRRELCKHPSLSLRPRLARARSREQECHELHACCEESSDTEEVTFNEKHLRTPFLQGTLPVAHGDYTARSGRTRAAQLLQPFVSDEQLSNLTTHRFAIVNVWHPFKTVEADPLAMCTWSSASPWDVVTSRITFPNRVGETYKVIPNNAQRWVYFSKVRNDESILLKVFDSDPDTARFTLHSAFSLPQTTPPPPPRESMEIRVLVLFAPSADDKDIFVRPFVPPHMATSLASHTKGQIEQPLHVEDLPPTGSW